MSHSVITCTCGPDRIAEQPIHSACPVPGHGDVPPDPVDPWALADAGREALGHLDDGVQSILKARAAWVSRGLDASNPFPASLDRLAGSMERRWHHLRRWTSAAERVARERSAKRQLAEQETRAEPSRTRPLAVHRPRRREGRSMSEQETAITDSEIKTALALLADYGYTVLRTKSYLAAQERQRIAQVRMEDAFEQVRSTERWARDAFAQERRLRDRCTHLYGLAARYGATDDELRGPPENGRSTDV